MWTDHTPCCFFFFFNDTATTEIYTLSLHDALPISPSQDGAAFSRAGLSSSVHIVRVGNARKCHWSKDRKSTRLNSSHSQISYAVFCLKKKKILEKALSATHIQIT